MMGEAYLEKQLKQGGRIKKGVVNLDRNEVKKGLNIVLQGTFLQKLHTIKFEKKQVENHKWRES